MNTLEWILWICFAIASYTYVGYGFVLYALLKLKRRFMKHPDKTGKASELPEITLLIPAYNERDFVHRKVANGHNLDYPAEKLKQVWITDGSDDGSPDLLVQYQDIKILHHKERRGKIAAMNRAMKEINSPIVVFSDANTLLAKESLMIIANAFSDPRVGCFSGEKRIAAVNEDAAAGSGEGLYWKYESTLKKWDAELNTAVGAAGELFAIRSSLFEEVEEDTLLDDFVISLRIVMKGYKIAYDPEAYAMETASASIKEELKRKIRIAAGGIQSIVRLRALLNIRRHGLSSFQYISHRVLRWTITPLLLPLIFIANLALADHTGFYATVLGLQVMFYLLAGSGWLLRNMKVRIKGFFIPYYFLVMNYAVLAGMVRYLKGSQTVNWEKVKRAPTV